MSSSQYQPDARVLMRRRVGSSDKAKRLLGWEAAISLDDGLRDAVTGCGRPRERPRHRGDRLRRVAPDPGPRQRRARRRGRGPRSRADHRRRRRSSSISPPHRLAGSARGGRDRPSRAGERAVPGRRRRALRGQRRRDAALARARSPLGLARLRLASSGSVYGSTEAGHAERGRHRSRRRTSTPRRRSRRSGSPWRTTQQLGRHASSGSSFPMAQASNGGCSRASSSGSRQASRSSSTAVGVPA